MESGYNATLGGDGKRLYDYNLVIKTYSEVQNISKTSKLLKIPYDTISTILHNNDIVVKQSCEINSERNSIKVSCFNKNNELLFNFNSLANAAEFIATERNISLEDLKGSGSIRLHIKQSCESIRKTAYGYIWKYKE